MIEIDWDELETILETLNALAERTPAQERLRASLQGYYDDEAER